MIRLLGHSIFPACLTLAIVLGLVGRFVPGLHAKISALLGRKFWLVLSVGLLVVYGAALAFRMLMPAPIDFVESTVISVSYLVLHAHPMYLGLSDADRYSIMYGPLCFLPYSASFFFLGSSFHAVAVAILLSNAALFAVLFLLFRKMIGGTESIVAMAFVASALMMKSSMTFMARGDSLLALSVAVALCASFVRSRWLAVALFVASAAMAVDIKITAVFYLLLPAYVFWRKQDGRATAAALFCMIPAVLAPFALPGISLSSYLLWLREASHHPLSLWAFALNAFVAVLALAPVCLLARQFHREDAEGARELLRTHWAAVLLLLLSVAGSAITGSKVGAGRYHLNPTFIVCAYAGAALWSKLEKTSAQSRGTLSRVLLVYSLFLVLPAASELQDMWWLCVRPRSYAARVNADLASIMARHASRKIEMGYGGNPADGEPVDALTTYRPLLVMAGNPLTIDVGALLDMQLSGVEIPQSTVDAVRSCSTDLWLIPKGSEPFSMLNGYAKVAPALFGDTHLFTRSFREAFQTRYVKQESSAFYDVWACRTGAD